MISKSVSFFVFLIGLNILCVVLGKDTCGNHKPFCGCINFENYRSTEVECDGFEKFSKLDFSPSINYRQYSKLILKPRNHINLDKTLKLDFNTTKNFTLIFYRVNKIDVTAPFFQNVKNLKEIRIIDSNLTFVNRDERCQDINNGIFSNLHLDKLEFDNVIFENKLCPAMFRNSSIARLDFIDTNMQNSIETLWDSHERITDKSFDFKIHIRELKVQNKDQKYLENANSLFFKHTHQLILRLANLKDINEYYFYPFKELRIFQLYNANMKQIFSSGSVKWLKWLNPANNYDLDNPNFETKHFKKFLSFQLHTGKSNDFSEESFCNFEYFPHNQLVFLLANFNEDAKDCSCTIYWLYKYYSLYSTLKFDPRLLPYKCLNITNLNGRIEQCDLDRRVNQCPGHMKDAELTSSKNVLANINTSLAGNGANSFTEKLTSSANEIFASRALFAALLIVSYY